jgi:hypothetical protein
MQEPLWMFLLKVFGGPLLSGLVAAGITYWFSRRRFIGERSWDRKADAYGSIIGSLVGMVRSLNSWIEREYSDTYTQETLNAITSEFGKARAKIEYAAIEGDYVISRKAASALSDLIEKLESMRHEFVSSPDWVNCLHNYHKEAESCLESIRAEAQSDLQVK